MSRPVRMALSYLALLVFTLFALAPIIRAVESVLSRKLALAAAPFRLTNSENAALVALTFAIAGLVFSSVVGFALSRRNVRPRSDTVGRSPWPQIVPALVLLAPLVFVVFRFGQLPSLLWIGAIYFLTAAPVCSWQLIRSYETIPRAAEEAALIDGCGAWRSFYSVIFPAVAPALLLTLLFSFAVAWNDYFIVGALPQSAPPALWNSYSAAVLLAALLLGFCLWLFGRTKVAES